MSKSKLKPCPFCGSNDISRVNSKTWGHLVKCDKCGSRTEYYFSQSGATRSWNRRVTSSLDLIDRSKIKLNYTGLCCIPPNDFREIAEYFVRQISQIDKVDI